MIVVDDASTDDTWDSLCRLAASNRVPLRPLRTPHNSGPAAARNVGWRASQGRLVAFTDDDCVPQPGWLAALASALDRADLVQGKTVPDPAQASNSGPFSRTLQVTTETGFYQTCNMGYHRDLLQRLGGFDERFRHPTGEDTDLAWRARQHGARSAFEPTAVVHHDVRQSSFLTHLRDTTRWEGVVLAVRLHPGLRRHLHQRWFWKDSHPPALIALGGVSLTVRPKARGMSRLTGVVLLLPYIRYRTSKNPLGGGPRRRLAALPAALVADLAEVGVVAAASVRYRSLLL
jgi:cellulose synthase/poly-beta-1,6-N-acetylglucosamine synthase-like glycosyltransferase